jgi:hypothetical protein
MLPPGVHIRHFEVLIWTAFVDYFCIMMKHIFIMVPEESPTLICGRLLLSLYQGQPILG